MQMTRKMCISPGGCELHAQYGDLEVHAQYGDLEAASRQ
jgi:hypothetical protein